MLFSKKFLTVAILSIIISAFLAPTLVSAQEKTACDKTKEPPTECWLKKDCKGNWYRGNITTKSCGSFEKQFGELGFCYAVEPNVELKIALGEKSIVKGLADYIGSIYNYLIAIVSIVAIVMIMIGGLKYLTAGGNPSAITSAKETILGAVIGLFLTLGSYTLLQTINPALVSLKLPDIKTVRTSTLCIKDMAAECPADSPQKTGKVGASITNCKNTCECQKGTTCEPVEGSAGTIISASKFVVWSATAVAGGAVVGGANVASGAKYIIEGAYDKLGPLAKKLGVKILKNPIKSGLGYLVVSSLGGSTNPVTKSVDNGICVALAKQTVSGGGLCAFTSNCIAGLKCIEPVSKKELTAETLGDIGSCVGNPKVFSGELACTERSTCVANAGANPKLECVGGFCSFGKEGHTCCVNGKIDGTNQLCGKGFNECETDPKNPKDSSKNFSCGFYYNGEIYMTNGQYSSESAAPGLLTALKTVIQNSSGRCIIDSNTQWAPQSKY